MAKKSLEDFGMRFSHLAILVVLSVTLALTYADDTPKNVDAPKEVERREALADPTAGQQQAEASETGKEFKDGVSRAERVRRWGYGYGGWGGGWGYRPWGMGGWGMSPFMGGFGMPWGMWGR
ncbi:hypothetical protein AAVH_21011 [Aphelenchoides avenae]|nr:hypothetical protein AAVH_21011 [Aphelenchus avenae]